MLTVTGSGEGVAASPPPHLNTMPGAQSAVDGDPGPKRSFGLILPMAG